MIRIINAKRQAQERPLAAGARFAPYVLLIAGATQIASAAAEPSQKKDDVFSGQEKLRGVETTLDEAGVARRKLESEISSLSADRERLNQTLIDATSRLRETEQQTIDIETTIETLRAREDSVVASLGTRRSQIGEVLAVLQRISRHPPPALLAAPKDALEAVRASLTLGAMLPQMRAEAIALQHSLAELVDLRDSQKREQTRLARRKLDLVAQRENLEQLIAGRQEALAQAQSALGAEDERIRKLAEQATSLKDLLARMEAESEGARHAAQAARQADAARETREAALSREQRAKALAAPFKDAARLAPAVAFGDLKGRLPLPAVGQIMRKFGASDGFGGVEKGLSIGAPPNATVAAPSDGWVVFSGPYRSYGQLLIINAGAGYYLVLAGMSRISVSVGQFVLAGEPVAVMGDGATQSAATIAIGAKQPILYVEFRKDGTSIDSSPWWAKSDSRKVGG